MKVPESLKAIFDFFLRVLTGTVIFALIALAAFLLKLLTDYAEIHRSLPHAMLLTMTIVEYVLFWIDVLVFLVFIVKEALIAIGILKPNKSGSG